MNATAYKVLGFAVWQGGKWYLRRNYGRYAPSGRTTAATAGALALVVGGAVLLSSRGGD